jgi:hypothetical protein
VAFVLVLSGLLQYWHDLSGARVFEVYVTPRTPVQTLDIPTEGLSDRFVVADHKTPAIVADCEFVIEFADGTRCLSREGIDKFPKNGPVTEGSGLWYYDHLRFGEDADEGQTFANGGPKVTVAIDLLEGK